MRHNAHCFQMLRNIFGNGRPFSEGDFFIIGYFLSAFPDMHIQIEDMIVEKDKLVARLSSHGTHQDECFGLPSTQKMFRIPASTLSASAMTR